ncbi:HIT-like domain-containing protein [Paraphysoderma sedebokerense]|nr:HIT-like domain-containing protein [Paraphysoderma sedebokerense]
MPVNKRTADGIGYERETKQAKIAHSSTPTSSSHWYDYLKATSALHASVLTSNQRSNALREYIETPEKFPPSIMFSYDKDTVIIHDKYPKAKVHLLLMPRRAVSSVEVLDSSDEDDKKFIDVLTEKCESVSKELEVKYPKLRFKCGVHAIPSMTNLHVHIISQDFASDCLKNKKHWNSFTTDFFVPWKNCAEMFKAQGRIRFDKRFYESLLKEPLKCNQCNEHPKNMPTLKKHLLTHM